MIKSKENLVKKLFIIVWCILAVHIALKLTFNYWQPYVIPNDRLQVISDFIDNNEFLVIIIDGILYTINGLLMILCSIKRWWFKNLKQSIIVIALAIFSYLHLILFGQSTILSLIINFAIPLVIDCKKWLYVILAFVFSNLFLMFSLFLEGFTNSNDMQYICKVFLQFDYYIMLVLNYFMFNLIKKENKNGK